MAEDEAAEKGTDEAKPIETESSKDGNLDEKPDINDVPMEENQVNVHTRVVHFVVFLSSLINFIELSVVGNKCCSYALMFTLCGLVLLWTYGLGLVCN